LRFTVCGPEFNHTHIVLVPRLGRVVGSRYSQLTAEIGEDDVTEEAVMPDCAEHLVMAMFTGAAGAVGIVAAVVGVVTAVGVVAVGVVAAVGVATGDAGVGDAAGVVADTVPRHVVPVLLPTWTLAGGVVGRGMGRENDATVALAAVKLPAMPIVPAELHACRLRLAETEAELSPDPTRSEGAFCSRRLALWPYVYVTVMGVANVTAMPARVAPVTELVSPSVTCQNTRAWTVMLRELPELTVREPPVVVIEGRVIAESSPCVSWPVLLRDMTRLA